MVQYNCLLKFKSAAAAAFTVTVPGHTRLVTARTSWPGPEAATAAADLGLGHGTYMLVRISLSSLTNCQ